MPNYVVLRNAAAISTASPFDSIGPELARATARGVVQPRVEVHDVSVNEAASMGRDPSVAAMAIPMPIALVRNVAKPAATATSAWGVAAVKADVSSCTGAGVAVSVLDTGIDRTHPAFAGVNIIERDFTGAGNGDTVGHGTHCAGTIFGRDVSGTRIGIARGVGKALIGKVLGATGGTSEMLFRGMQWALDEGAQVISMSLGFDFPGAVKEMEGAGMPTEAAVSNALEAYRSNLRFFDALMAMIRAQAAFRDTAVVVAAAGNESDRPAFTVATSLPGAAEGVVSVAALARSAAGKFDIAPFSNTRAQIAAPGVDILSARHGGGLVSFNGTSMACPHVAGVAALWWESLKKSNAVVPTANLVMANLLAHARTDVLASGAGLQDRGTGIVTAPE